MEAPPDQQYVMRIASRADVLQRKSVRVREDVIKTRRTVTRVSQDLHTEFFALQRELVALDEECHATVERVKTTITKFTSVVKKAELERLKLRVDAWAPEQKISKVSFRRLLNSKS